jgi:tartrate dehydratase alpha subunit/fumarate hydratase class I-like protein
MAPLTMYDEKNTGTNLPAEIKISAIDGEAYKFLFMAKGGGSANKSYLFQETKALLNEKTLLPWLFEKMKTLGTSACPPYHLAVVIGGTSAEMAVETAKLASTRYLDTLPTEGSILGHAFRDIDVALDRAVDDDGLGFDLTLHVGALADGEGGVGNDLAFDFAVENEVILEFECAFDFHVAGEMVAVAASG